MTAVERLAEKAKSATGDTLVIVEHGGSSDRILAHSLHIAADCVALVERIYGNLSAPTAEACAELELAVVALAARIKEADGTAPSP